MAERALSALLKPLIVVISYHHGNTAKVAGAMAQVLGARTVAPNQIRPDEVREYDMVGFGSGIYDSKHHKELLALVDSLPTVTGAKAFIFSTSSLTTQAQVAGDHSTLRGKLQSKGYAIVGEFCCKGLNTNSLLRHLGGLNKGRPNAEDLRHAEEFALGLRKNCVT